jgi:hypothetical protein
MWILHYIDFSVSEGRRLMTDFIIIERNNCGLWIYFRDILYLNGTYICYYEILKSAKALVKQKYPKYK